MSGQTWNSPKSGDAPPPWLVDQAPPPWVADRAEAEGWPEDAIATWRAALSAVGVTAVALTQDVRGVTIDFDHSAPQPLNPDNAQPLHSALTRGLARLEAISKVKADNLARQAATRQPDE